MTHQTPIPLDLFDRAERGLRYALADLVAKLEPPGDETNDPPDKTARAISILLKSLEDLTAQRARAEAREQAARHTAYEDLPPPSPEDEARFYDLYQTLFDYVVDAEAAGLDLASDAGAPAGLAGSHMAADRQTGSDRRR